jgi:hypothetical protein
MGVLLKEALGLWVPGDIGQSQYQEWVFLEELDERISGLVKQPFLKKRVKAVLDGGPVHLQLIGQRVDVHADATARDQVPQEPEVEIIIEGVHVIHVMGC